MIIQTTDNRFYRVEETNRAELSHLWFGLQVKKSKGEWTLAANGIRAQANGRQELVRKAATRVVEA